MKRPILATFLILIAGWSITSQACPTDIEGTYRCLNHPDEEPVVGHIDDEGNLVEGNVSFITVRLKEFELDNGETRLIYFFNRRKPPYYFGEDAYVITNDSSEINQLMRQGYDVTGFEQASCQDRAIVAEENITFGANLENYFRSYSSYEFSSDAQTLADTFSSSSNFNSDDEQTKTQDLGYTRTCTKQAND